jgi:putative SOS response-associated peptidase YedK
MCGRFGATSTFREIKLRWNLQNELLFEPRYNVAPSQTVPVIVRAENGNEARPMKWGLVPSWARESSIGSRLINARAETLLNKSSFQDLIGRRRCLVPADGFYEWRRIGSRKMPMWIYWKTGEPFAFAALWDSWHDRKLGCLDTFTIITTEPNDFMRPIHNRMPVMFDQTAGQRWLDQRADRPFDVSAMLRPCPSERMAAHEVLPLVNAPENDRIECIQPISASYLPRGQLPLL